MVNKVVLEYFRVNKGNYKIEDLKKKVLAAGYSQKDIDDAVMQLGKQTKGAAPSVAKTVKQINATQIEEKGTTAPATQAAVAKKETAIKPKKSKKWLWIILSIVLFILIAAGIAVWFFFDEIIRFFGL